MAKPRVKLSHEGVKELLVQTAPLVEQAAKQVASNIPAKYRTGTLSRLDRKGRPVTLVALQEPNGVALQAKYGLMTKAAAEAGLDIHRYPIEGA